jgi:hypothetical protein
VTAAPLAVVAELNAPQESAGAQLHVTPPFAGSLATVAVMGSVSFSYSKAGVVLSVTVIVGDGVMVMAAVLALTAELAIEVAVMTTVDAGTAAGAV